MEAKDIHILLVDDEPDILEILDYNLSKEEYQIHKAENGKEALKIIQNQIPHLVILDMMMPGLNGIETCQKMREIPEMEGSLIIFLTALNDDQTEMKSYQAGADDFITKPIRPKVLVSKVKALLRRTLNDSMDSFQIGELSINKDAYELLIHDQKIHLPKKEFELLVLLAEEPGKVFSRNEILDKVWGQDVVVGDRTVDVHIRKLREKIGEEKIETITGIGYKFVNP